MLTQGLERAELQREVAGVDGERRRTALCTGAGRGGALGLVRLRQGDVGCGRGPGRV